MKELRPTTQYKKDFKRYRNQPKKLIKLFEIYNLLRNGKPIPQGNKSHPLTGNYKGCMECHIEGDLLLIWIDEEKDIIELVRLGTHSELFV